MRLDDGSLHPLRSEVDLALYRGRLVDHEATILVLKPVAGDSSPEARHRLSHEYALADQLDGTWAARPLALLLHDGQPALILEDHGGNPLVPSVTGPLPVERFLRVAVSAVAALRRVHAQGLIHKDIKPSNLLVDAEGVVRVTGFGIASRLPREQQQLAAPATIGGTLAYMAPEQTGRMNRSIDTRSDLYSLGVSLYELLCGVLPFQANEPLEWVHCHVARTPLPVGDIVPGLPRPIAAIVMKLLSKSAEDRYQTAAGLERDLVRCLSSLEQEGAVDPFPLGEADIPDRLIISERLYGREEEIALLSDAFKDVAETGRSRIWLVSGYSGIGKSAVVNELRPVLVRAHGLMACGKFDQYRRDVPYAIFAEVFRNITQRVLGTPPAERERWRNSLQGVLGDSGQVMVNLIPELETLLGKQPAIAELSPRDGEALLHRMVREFLDAFVEAGYSLALFVDDLQWLDSASLNLLKALFDFPLPRSLMLIGAYRDNEVDDDHPLRKTIDGILQSGVEVQELTLGTLPPEDLNRLIADTLRSAPQGTEALAQLIHAKTGGNPFFVRQFITALADEGLLSFDHAALTWRWDLDEIGTKGFTDNVADLVAGRLIRLSAPTLGLLTTLAYLGTGATAERLAIAHGVPLDEVGALAEEGIAAGLILQASGSYRFIHDRVQEAVHAMTKIDQRPALHLQMGRRLACCLHMGDRDDTIFEVVDQYNCGLDLIDSQQERDELAALNLRAGQRARASIAFAAALNYLQTGRKLLGEHGWGRANRLVFDLVYHEAECQFLTGDQQKAEAELLSLMARASDLADRGAIASLLITLFTASDRSDRAVQVCLAFLHELGVDWSEHPSPEEAWREYRILIGRLGSRSIHSLIDLPETENRDSRAVLDVLGACIPPAFFSDQNLVCLMLCWMANYSLDHGNCSASPLGYAYLGMVTGPFFENFRAGFEFGQLGRDLVEERGFGRYAARVHMTFAYHVAPWTQHISYTLPLLTKAFEIAVRAGDLTYCGFTSSTILTSLLAAGTPLAEVQREAETRLGLMRQLKFGLISDIITSKLLMIRSLRGLIPYAVNESEPSEELFEARLESEAGLAIAACWHWITKLQRAVLGGDYQAGLAAAARAEPLLWTTAGHLEMVEYHFYAALAHAGCSHEGDPAQHHAPLLLHQKQLHLWAKNCPQNFGAASAIIDAMIASSLGQGFVAMRHFEDAIRIARESRLAHIEALAHEMAAGFYRRHDFSMIANTYLRNARDCYLRWGATAKVQQLEQMGRDSQPVSSASPVVSTQAQLGMLDLNSLIHASRVVSDEVGLRRLIETLLTMVIEHAGAQRGLLLTPRLQELSLEAEVETARDGAEIRFHRVPVTSAHAPLALLHHAMSMRSPVLLDDAERLNPYSGDVYFANRRTRSVLCVPLLKQQKLTGIIYLENNLLPYVFTPSRVSVLQLLASQAAISLENAALEEKEALLKEMHHRVKNNLQLISSLLNLQAAQARDPAVAHLFIDSRDRVRSMALVHENLYRADGYARVPMHPHIESLCTQLEHAYRPQDRAVTLAFEIEEIMLDLDRAVPCGLIVNELVSNAFKHAFPDGRVGRITVALTSCGPQQCCLTVSDNGIGLPIGLDPDTAPTLGLQLVGDLVHQLHGVLTIDRTTGVTFVIVFRNTVENVTTEGT
jgi:predicted ATPase/two-component sensor histidine kinase